MAKTRAQLEAENAALRASSRAAGWVRVSTTAITWLGIVLIARYTAISIEALAGKSTLAKFGLEFFGTVEVSVALAWTVGIFGTVYGLRQKNLRKRTVERLQGRITSLEAAIDPARSSSKLTTRGETRPEDRK